MSGYQSVRSDQSVTNEAVKCDITPLLVALFHQSIFIYTNWSSGWGACRHQWFRPSIVYWLFLIHSLAYVCPNPVALFVTWGSHRCVHRNFCGPIAIDNTALHSSCVVFCIPFASAWLVDKANTYCPCTVWTDFHSMCSRGLVDFSFQTLWLYPQFLWLQWFGHHIGKGGSVD